MRIVCDGPPGIHSWSRNVIPLAVACSTRRSACSREWMKNPFVPNRRLCRWDSVGLRNPLLTLVVRREVEVGRAVDHQRARPGEVEPVGERPELVLVDELLDGLARREAGREPLAHVRRKAGDRERPLVAARQKHGPRQVERTQEGREDLRVRGFREGRLGRSMPAGARDDIGRVIDDIAPDAPLREDPQRPERRDVRAEDQDGDGRCARGLGHDRIIAG